MKDCFSVFGCHTAVKCDLASSEKYKRRRLFLSECDMKEKFGVRMSQKYDRSMICQTAETLLRAQRRQDYKKGVFLNTLIIVMQIENFTHTQKKKKKKEKEQVGFPKIDKKGQIALSDYPFRCRVTLWSDTKRDMQQKNNVILQRKSD